MTTPSPRPAPETTVRHCATCERETTFVRKWVTQRAAFKHVEGRRRLAWVCVTCGGEA